MKNLLFLLFPFFCFSENLASLVERWPSSYLNEKFTDLIDKDEVNTIVELGSFNGLDSILLHEYYNCPVYAFECDPCRFEVIERRFQSYPHIHFIKKGVMDVTHTQVFYSAGFPGASSFFEFNLDLMAKWNKLTREELLNPVNGQCRVTEIVVNTIRLDEWIEENNIDNIDLLCMDVQGAALNVFKGLGNHLKNVKYIITEVELKPIYEKEALLLEVRRFLKAHGFKLHHVGRRHPYFNDEIFINTRI